jgi:cobalt-zinc-cadmium efflux system membrane fusion protein
MERGSADERPQGLRALSARAQYRLVAMVAAGLLLLLGSWTGISWLMSGGTDSGPSQTIPYGTFRPTQAQLAGLTIKPVLRRDFPAVTNTEGNIAADDDLTTPVYSPFSGRVTKLEARLGDNVAKGAPLMTVEAQEYVQAQNDLIAAMSGLASTTAQLNLAETNETREHALFDARGAALKDWQQSQSDLATAQGNRRTAEIALAAVRNRLRIFGMSDRQIAALARAPIGVQTSPEATVAAPIAGTVILRQVGLGQFIQSGASNPVFSIGDLSTVWLIANVRESDAPLMQVGEPVAMHVPALPGRVFHAKLSYVAASVDPVTRRLQVRADVANTDGALKPQMFASFSIVTGEDRSAPAVPQSSIVYEGDAARVWILRRDGLLALRQIRVGRTDGDRVEVLQGVAAGERVVTSGAIFIDRAATSD